MAGTTSQPDGSSRCRGGAALVAALLALIPALRPADWSLTALPRVASNTGMGAAALARDPHFHVVRTGDYDGQFYWGIAVDPIATGDVHQSFDTASYRYGHPLLGWLGWGLSAGQARAVPAALLAVGVLSLVLAAFGASLLDVGLGGAGLVRAVRRGQPGPDLRLRPRPRGATLRGPDCSAACLPTSEAGAGSPRRVRTARPLEGAVHPRAAGDRRVGAGASPRAIGVTRPSSSPASRRRSAGGSMPESSSTPGSRAAVTHSGFHSPGGGGRSSTQAWRPIRATPRRTSPPRRRSSSSSRCSC